MRTWFTVTALFVLALWQPAAAQTANPIIMTNGQPVEVCGIWIKPRLYARTVVTQTEICLENPNTVPLEGELRFPLRESQTVTGFTLSPAVEGGPVMQAVPVPKAKGTKVFEAVERTMADPALMERAEGNIYSLRVYPLMPKIKRVVTVFTTEPIIADAKGMNRFDPTLAFAAIRGGKNTVLSVEGDTAGIPIGALRFDPGYKRTGFVRTSPESTKFSGFLPLDKPRTGLRIDWTAPGGDSVIGSWFERRPYFAADVAISGAAVPRPVPAALALIWDASGSGVTRDHAREFAVLDAYFRKLGRTEVTLVVARDRAEAPRTFAIANGDWSDLRKVLEATPYDGASNPAAWAVPAGFDGESAVALLVSDGLANWGAAAARFPVTLFTLNASPQADAGRLRHMAEAANGQYLDLTTLSTAQAVADLTTIRPRLVSLTGDAVDDLVAASVHPESGRLSLAGQITGPKASVTVETVDGAGKVSRKRLSVTLSEDRESDGFAAKRWASLRIASLQSDGNLHRAEILRLGETFGVISDETSLLALERLEDFLRYKVMPPPGEMRAAYLDRAPADPLNPKADTAQVEDLVRRFAELTAWWERDFPKGEKPKPKPEPEGDRAVSAVAAAMAPVAKSSASPSGSPSSTAKPAEVEIHLRKWEPNAPYLSSIKEASAEQRYDAYLAQRVAYANSTAFFIDAADIFFAAGQDDMAVRVLSNVAELGWSNRSLLRILAYRLLQSGRADLAMTPLTRVRDLAPEEPQSWRDLGLANAAAGNAQEAVNFLWHVASHQWDRRFADIDLISLGELNALAARAKTVDLSRVEPRLQRNLPVDLRTVLTWDADNTDMDLWVTDPNGERAFYANRLTYQGGHMSRDFTGGLGPEEFMLKRAKPGTYEVRVNFYGHRQQVLSPYTTVMMKFSSGFGTDHQKDQDIVLRLSGRGESVFVGTFEVKGDGSGQ
jgi:Ca-activated chloride channel family protein